MAKTCRIRFTRAGYDQLHAHLFPGDGDEHGAVLLASVTERDGQTVFLVREVHLAREGTDYVEGQVGYRALHPAFIHRMITRARDQQLAYLAVHNHHSDRHVGFSRIDLDSHALGYPALLQIARGRPVGALVLGERSMQADIWLNQQERLSLEQAVVVGQTVKKLYPAPPLDADEALETYDRQLRWFGGAGQRELALCKVAIIGLGGVGSLVAELLARLGVGKFTLIDNDVVETTNLSRIVGATAADAEQKRLKVEVAQGVIQSANASAAVERIADDVVRPAVANQLRSMDYIFLAADSMRARLVFNAVVHQYLIPGVQLGAKIRASADGEILDVMSAVRGVRPGEGCLWCNGLIDPMRLAQEAKTDEERKAQAYGVKEANPSVITLNAVAAAHAVNDFLLDYLELRPTYATRFEHFHHLNDKRMLVAPRVDATCMECSCEQGRLAKGDALDLPVQEDPL